MAAVARAEGISIDRIRQIKEKGLRRLWIGKAKRELLEKFDIAESRIYRRTLENFREHDSSITEYLAIQRAEAEERYKQHLTEIGERQRKVATIKKGLAVV